VPLASMISKWFGLGVVLLSSIAVARPDIMTITQPPQMAPNAVLTNESIYLNNCGSGCSMKPGTTDATTDTTNIASSPATFHEYACQAGEWDQVVQCVKE